MKAKSFFVRLMSMVLCFAMLFAVAGCGDKETVSSNASSDDAELLEFNEVSGEGITSDDNTDSQSSNTASGSDSSVTVSEPVEMSSDDPFANIPSRLRGTTVTFAHFGDEGAAIYQPVFDAFTKKTGIKVKLVPYAEATYYSDVAKKVVAKTGPDMIICNGDLASAFEIAQPIQNIIDLSDDFWDDNISNTSTVKGNTYFVNSFESIWQDIYVCYYWDKIFKDTGLNTPMDYWNAGQWTYENCEKLLREVSSNADYMGGFVDGNYMATALGTPIVGFDPATGKFVNNISKVSSIFEYTTNHVKSGYWNAAGWRGNFTNGNIGIFFERSWGFKKNGTWSESNGKQIKMAPLPTSFKGQAAKAGAQFRGYGIAKGAKNPEGAAYLIRWFLDYENYKDAGVDIFFNSDLEKTYFDVVVPNAQKVGIAYDFTEQTLKLTGNTLSDILNDIETSETAQVAGTLAAKKNIFDNAVNAANEKVKSIS